MAEWYLGTMGFGYKDWQGVFYPAGVRSRAYLEYYSQIFNAVEMDTTFYGIPAHLQWRVGLAPRRRDSRICAKTPRTITHDMSLAGSASLMKEFADAMRLLGNKLGAILIQLPPSFDITHHLALAAFLEELPQAAAGMRVAIEFRHRSWYTPQTVELLRTQGVCWAATEYPHLPGRSTGRPASFISAGSAGTGVTIITTTSALTRRPS